MTNIYNWTAAFEALDFVPFHEENNPFKDMPKANVEHIEDTLIELCESYGMNMAYVYENGEQSYVLYDDALRFLPMAFGFDGLHLILWGDQWSRTYSEDPKESARLASLRFNTLVGQFEKFALATNV